MGAIGQTPRASQVKRTVREPLRLSAGARGSLFYQCGVIEVNPAEHPVVKKNLGKLARILADRVMSPRGAGTLADYKIEGQQLFFPNANACSR